MLRLFKMLSWGFLICLIITLSYPYFVKYLPKNISYDNSKLHTILEEEKIKFSNKSYNELVMLMKSKRSQPHLFTIQRHGVIYKLEVSSYWVNEYQKDGDIIIYLSVYEGFPTAQNALRDTLIKSKY